LRPDRDAADLRHPGVQRRRLRPQPIGTGGRDAAGRAFAREVARARELEHRDAAAALGLVRELVARHPEFAETQYRLGRLLEQAGDPGEARRHYILAREGDGLPLRCPESFRRAHREVAAKYPSILLVDGPAVLEATSPDGIADDRLLHDAQHPNIRGYAALAQDLLGQLRGRRAFGWPEGAGISPVEEEECIRHFGIDAGRWADVCRQEAWFYEITAYVRYDPAFRLERCEDYRRAAKAIRAGRDPHEAGIPGWGIRPPDPTPPHPSRPGGPGPIPDRSRPGSDDAGGRGRSGGNRVDRAGPGKPAGGGHTSDPIGSTVGSGMSTPEIAGRNARSESGARRSGQV
jgi:hypothetical protein